MATNSSALPAPSPQGLDGRISMDRVVETDPPSSLTLALTAMRIFLDPAREVALFRFRITVPTSRDPLFLDLSPDNIANLSVHPGPPTVLHFRVAALTLIGPKEMNQARRPCIHAHSPTLDALRFLSQHKAMRVLLAKKGGYQTLSQSQLSALCEAVNRGGLRPDPQQTDFQSLYRGNGGRVISMTELLSSSPASLQDFDVLPPKDLFSTGTPGDKDDDDELPPYRDRDRDQDLAPPSSPRPPPPVSHPGPSKKRRRSHASALTSPVAAAKSPLSSPPYHTYRHFDLVCGEREKMLAELLQRADAKEKRFIGLMDVLEVKEARVDEVITRLNVLLVKAEGALRDAGFNVSSPSLVPKDSDELQAQIEKKKEKPMRRQMQALPRRQQRRPSPPTCRTVCRPTLVHSWISSEMSWRTDMRRTKPWTRYETRYTKSSPNYVTTEMVEQRVAEEVDRVLSSYVEEHQMFEAIREATDQAIEEVRSRVLAAWE